jgi:hypothetical protein
MQSSVWNPPGWNDPDDPDDLPVTASPITDLVPVQRINATETFAMTGNAATEFAFAIPDEPEPDNEPAHVDQPGRWSAGGVRALIVFTLAAVVYGITAWRLGHTKTPAMAYWDQLADSLRRGRLYLPSPSSTHDLTLHDGKWFVPFPPLPALLLVPWALITPILAMNTVAFSVILGSINVTLVDALLRTLRRRSVVRLSNVTIISLVVMWAVGTVHWYMAVAGTVWFVSQIATATFLLLSLWSAAAGRRLLAGVALGLAALGRPTILLALPAVVALAALANPHPEGRRRWPQALSMITIPAGLIAAGLLWYNKARFGSPTDFGYTAQNVARELAPDLKNYGQFNIRYVPRNLWSMLAAGPVKDPRSWAIRPDGQGMSMFLTTPAWILVFFADARQRLTRWCWLAVLLLIVPLVAYYNGGWYQFGYRFALDFMPVLMVLLALGLDRYQANFGRVLPKVLIAVGIVANLWGTIWFK